jgi:GMP synthase-like glutamine amidotransferase
MNKMRTHYLQHVPFEDLGSIEGWLLDAGHEISCTRLYESEGFPEIAKIDLLVVMGGPMSVNDEQKYSWLVEEKNFIKNVIESGKPVLGICLGAQLIADSMGGDVFQNSVKEIGWLPITAAESQKRDLFLFPEETEVFHWHGETFSLPNGAIRTAESKGCKNQAFQIGRNVIGLQFHLETTQKSAQDLVDNCQDELVDGEYIQTAAEILSVSQERYDSINSLMGEILEYLLDSNR